MSRQCQVRKVEGKAKSNVPATEKIKTYGQPYSYKSDRTPFNPYLKSKRVWFDRDLVKIAIQVLLAYQYFTMVEENFEKIYSQIFLIRIQEIMSR